ncbi:ATP-binding cassette domain-containing protein [Corynebacterium sp. H128]|uniref:ATP-binding cassette domain-containing protein n=1 Tax=unclassified Corynebacterium TaxID=2624378 RepID=UPI0030AB1C8E
MHNSDLFADLRPASAPLHGRSLCKDIGKRALWHDLDLTMQPGTITAITGRSGAGKTTLLNTLGLLEPLTSGTVVYGDQTWSDFSRSRVRKLYRNTVGFLFQNFALVENWSIEKNLNLALASSGTPRRDRPQSLDSALSAVNLTCGLDTPVYTLSGGEQQRVAIARLLLHRPQVVFADEPTSALDTDNATNVTELLRRFADNGAIVVISTHNPDTARASDQLIHLG